MGRVGDEDYQKLARLLAEKKFFEFEDRYASPITDAATWTTTAKRGERLKKVSNYGDAGPDGLKEIEKLIIKMMEKIEWRKVD